MDSRGDSSSNVSTNVDRKITSTSYSASGSLYAYPTVDEVNIRLGQAVAVANVVGANTGPTAYPDLLVGAPNASQAGTALRFTGCVFVFNGTGVGQFSATASSIFCQPNPIASGNQNGLNFGSAIAVGDMDADTIPDVVVTNPVRATAYIFRTQNSSGTLSIGTNGVPIPHPSANTSFGTGVCIGDSDGVGALDLFFTTPTENCNTACGGVTGSGNVLVYNNTSTPGVFIAPNTMSYRISPTHSLQAAGYSISNGESVTRSCAVGNFDSGNLTQTQLVVGSGTVNFGAGVGADGMIAFYRRTGAGSFTFQNVVPSTTPPVTGNNWGNAVAAIQIGTSQHELAVGAPLDDNVGTDAGAVFLYNVSTSASNFVLTDSGNAYYGGSDFDNNGAGIAVAAGNIWGHAGDVQDLVVGAYLDDITNTIGANSINLGQVFTYRNVSENIEPTAQQSSFDTSSLRVKNDQLFGQSLCKGDVNNDGREDIMIGSPHTDYDVNTLTQNTDVGSVYVYYGVAAGEIDFANPSQIVSAPGAQSGGRFGYSCLVMDYNADGQNDLIVGSPYRDVVQGDRGAVYIYYGAASSALPSSNSATLNAPSATASLLFGWALTKGDFDNNGFDDLAVGMPGLTGAAAATGGVYVFWAQNTTGVVTPTNFTLLQPPNGAVGGGSNPHLANTQTANANLNLVELFNPLKPSLRLQE